MKQLRGHAIAFNQESLDLGGFVERVSPDVRVQHGDVLGLAHHNAQNVLGRKSAGTLRLQKDRIGLAFEIDLPDHAESIWESVSRGDLKSMSFGFRALEDEWHQEKNGKVIRTLKAIELIEVSIVTWPAYVQTDVSAVDGAPTRVRQLECSVSSNARRRQLDLASLDI